MKPLILVALLFLFFAAFLGCGDDGNPMAPDGGVDLPGILPPNPDGVLLGGGETEPARSSLLDLAPSAVDAAGIVDGFLTTRLTAMVAPGATVSAVNTALEAQGARIVSMSRTSPFVTLKIPAVVDAAAAREIASALVATGAFLYAAPAHSAEVSGASGGPLRSADAPDAALPHHLEAMRLPAAWNAKALALSIDDRITVLVPDEYASLLPHGDIDAQAFVGYGGPNSLPGPEIYPGNNGFAVAGIIGANPDEIGATGINPAPADLLDIDSMALGGLTWFDLFNSLSWRLAASGNRFVLNTGIAYLDPDFVTFTAVDRAMHVLAWRVAAALHYHQFVHIVAAGEVSVSGRRSPVDEALLRTPFLAAAHFDDVREMVDLTQVGTADSLALETAWQDMIDNFPLATAIANNVMVVGSAAGTRSAGSPLVPDYVAATGANVLGPCVSQDPASGPGYLCDGEVAVYGGTAMAAAQVSGLAAYLMNLSDALPADVRDVLRHAYQSSQTGVVDAYHAVLALDAGVDCDVRRTILDVAGFESDESDGDFDGYDLPWLAPAVSESAARSRGGGGAPPLRYDLNGDGVVGGLGTYRFDLNADRSYGTVSQSIEGSSVSFDENAVTDFEVLCYYAYSPLYNGDPAVRQQTLVPLHGGAFLEFLNLPDQIIAGMPTEIAVRAGVNNDGVITYLEGIELDIFASNGDVDVPEPLTGPGGIVSATVTLYPDENELELGAEAGIGDEFAEIAAVLVRPNEVQIKSRTIYMLAEVAFGYSLDSPFQWIFDNYDWIDQVDPFDAAVDTSITKGGAGSAQGMTANGTITTTQRSSVDLYEGDHFAGCSFDATITGNLSLANPNLKTHYQCESEASSEMEVEFVVWGTAAEFNMHGTVSSKYYDVDFDGPGGTIFLCDSGDEPCFTISTGGTLGPGEYTLSIDIADDLYFGENCDQEPGCSQSGSETQESSLSLNFEVMPQ